MQQHLRQNDPLLSAESELGRALAECRAKLEHELGLVHDGRSYEPVVGALHDAVADFAAISRRLALPPERVLVIFKTTMHTLAATERWRLAERDALTRNLVHLAIEAYYRDGDGNGA